MSFDFLVVTLITDEDDDHSSGEPADWEQALVAAKAGDPGAVVMLGILPDGNLSDGLCRGSDDAPQLQALTTSLTPATVSSSVLRGAALGTVRLFVPIIRTMHFALKPSSSPF